MTGKRYMEEGTTKQKRNQNLMILKILRLQIAKNGEHILEGTSRVLLQRSGA